MEIFSSLPKQELSSTFPSQFESLSAIAQFVRKAAELAGLDDFGIYAVETAVDEACSNIIEHAYQGRDDGLINCTCKLYPQDLFIILNDAGIPFDPGVVPNPDIDASLEDRPDHGLGLYMIRQLMDEVKFNFDAKNGNTLILRKHIKPTG